MRSLFLVSLLSSVWLNLPLARATDETPQPRLNEASGSEPKPTVPPGGVPLKKRQSAITGLMVTEINSRTAGLAAILNITAVENGTAGKMVLKFNQRVGNQMTSAAHEAEKHLSVIHNGLPTGWDVEIGFPDRIVPKDGPSAAVACALLMDSLITGSNLDKDMAVTGDINADGSIMPVGGVPDKIKAAGKAGCTLVCIPSRNAALLPEYAVAFGPEIFVACHIFEAGAFAEAKNIALLPRPEPLQRALSGFKEIQQAAARQKNLSAWFKHPKVVERLKALAADAPQSVSIRALLAVGEGREPKILSIRGSFEIVYSQVLPWRAAQGGYLKDSAKDRLESAGMIRKIRDRLDPRIRPYAGAAIDSLSPPDGIKPTERLAQEQRELFRNKEVLDLLLSD